MDMRRKMVCNVDYYMSAVNSSSRDETRPGRR
jgi:hypothetical protein